MNYTEINYREINYTEVAVSLYNKYLSRIKLRKFFKGFV